MLKRLTILIVLLAMAALAQSELVGTYKKTINSRTQTLVLSGDRNAHLTTEYSTGKILVQKGTWKASGRVVTLDLSEKNGQYAPERIVFQVDDDELVATEYNVKNWGATGLVLERHDPNRSSGAVRPVIETLVVSPARALKVGEVLTVLMTGTPGGQASFEVLGAADQVALPEISSGRYQANLTLTRQMVVREAALVARLSVRGQEVVKEASRTITIEGPKAPTAARITLLPGSGAQVFEARPVIGASFSSSVQGSAYRLYFNDVDVTAQARMTQNTIRYAVRQNLDAGRHTARLVGPGTDEAWDFNIVYSTGGLQMSPANGAQVSSPRPRILARFQQPVQTGSVRVWLDANEVTGQTSVTRHEVSYQPGSDLQPGQHEVGVSGRGVGGQPLNYSWKFQVTGTSTPVGGALQVTYPASGQTVPQSFVVTGTATPGSVVELSGTVTQPLIPGVVGVKSQDLKKSAQSQANGSWQIPISVLAARGSIVEMTLTARDASGAQAAPVRLRCTIGK